MTLQETLPHKSSRFSPSSALRALQTDCKQHVPVSLLLFLKGDLDHQSLRLTSLTMTCTADRS